MLAQGPIVRQQEEEDDQAVETAIRMHAAEIRGERAHEVSSKRSRAIHGGRLNVTLNRRNTIIIIIMLLS